MFKSKKKRDRKAQERQSREAMATDSTIATAITTDSDSDSDSRPTTDPESILGESYGHRVLGRSFVSRILGNYYFKIHEDYIEFPNGTVGAIILIYDRSGKSIDLKPQWGVEFIRGLVSDTNELSGVNITFINTIQVMPAKWTERKQNAADRSSSQPTGGSKRRSNIRARARDTDFDIIAQELDGADRYLITSMKYVINAKSLEVLDSLVDEMQRRLRIRLPGILLALPYGRVVHEYNQLFGNPEKQLGRKLMFTTHEYGGSYNLVTQGVNDPTGVNVGEQVGDINNTAVIWDMSRFSERAVMAIRNKQASSLYDRLGGEQIPNGTGGDLWYNALVNQLFMADEGRIFTFALTDLRLSNRLYPLTNIMDLGKGGINPVEMFGEPEDELDIFAAKMQTWTAMIQQLNEKQISLNGGQDDLTNINLASLDKALRAFYIDNHVWAEDAPHNRHKLRVVGIPHKDVNFMRNLLDYIESLARRASNDPIEAASYKQIQAIISRTLTTSADLFDTPTSDEFDRVRSARHNFFSYATLARRGTNILLAQLINSFEAIANQTDKGDVLIFYGAELIDSITEQYLENILAILYKKGVRVVFCYSSVEALLSHNKLSRMETADWVLTGFMSPTEADDYDKALRSIGDMTTNIRVNITNASNTRYYLRRGYENVVFDANPTI